MSQENVEMFREAVAAYNRRDINPFLESWHPEIEWYPYTATIEGGRAYHGHQGLRLWWKNTDAAFEELEATVSEVRDPDDIVVGLGRLRARSRSGLTLDTEIGWLFRFRDGLVVWARSYESHAEALEAAGLSE
jgi:ketosteroid isomerase-like protein